MDDNDTNRRVIGELLAGADYDVETAASAIEGLSVLQRAAEGGTPFQAVLTDHRMPGIDGIEFARRIRALPAIEATRLVLYSSIDDKSSRQELRELGFAGRLSKPMRRTELLATLERVLSHAALEFTQQLRAIVTRDVIVEDHQRRGRTVLLVEDNATNRRVAELFLERSGCEVVLAADGGEALAILKDRRVDLVLMDVQMPVVDGLEATRRIRQEVPGGARLPIVGLTANALKEQVEACRAAGMDDVIAKPIERERLEAVIERYAPAVGIRTGRHVVHAHAGRCAARARGARRPRSLGPAFPRSHDGRCGAGARPGGELRAQCAAGLRGPRVRARAWRLRAREARGAYAGRGQRQHGRGQARSDCRGDGAGGGSVRRGHAPVAHGRGSRTQRRRDRGAQSPALETGVSSTSR